VAGWISDLKRNVKRKEGTRFSYLLYSRPSSYLCSRVPGGIKKNTKNLRLQCMSAIRSHGARMGRSQPLAQPLAFLHPNPLWPACGPNGRQKIFKTCLKRCTESGRCFGGRSGFVLDRREMQICATRARKRDGRSGVYPGPHS
jgi:hypothetical protein